MGGHVLLQLGSLILDVARLSRDLDSGKGPEKSLSNPRIINSPRTGEMRFGAVSLELD